MSDRRCPLCWPAGWPRTERPKRSPFKFGRNTKGYCYQQGAAAGAALDEMLDELRLLGARSVTVSTNVKLRLDGLPYANQKEPEDSGVAVYFELGADGEEKCIPCDRWDRVGCNYHAIALTIRALRGLERWGAKQMVDAAFRGFKALPAAEGYSSFEGALIALAHLAYGSEDGWERLKDEADREAAFRIAAKKLHPDVGGDAKLFAQLTQLRQFLENAA